MMNRLLRLDEYTIYQASFANDDQTSILQVVKNPGWITPYVACGLVIVGLLLQFCSHLARALRKAKPKATISGEHTRPECGSSAARRENWSGEPPDQARGPRAIPGQDPAVSRLDLLVTGVATLVVFIVLGLAAFRQTTPHGQLGSVPVQANGRIQPLDTLARESLLLLSGKSTVPGPEDRALDALDWLVAVVTDPVMADALPVFRIVHPEVLTLVAASSEKPMRLSFDLRRPTLTAIRDQARAANELSEKDPYRRAILQLDNALHTYAALRLSFRPVSETPSFAHEWLDFNRLIPNAINEAVASDQPPFFRPLYRLGGSRPGSAGGAFHPRWPRPRGRFRSRVCLPPHCP